MKIFNKIFPYLFWCLTLFLSFAIMFSSFSYQKGSFLIGTKLWSDFAAHIPLIRSFSFGYNFPPEYPIFPNFPIHYHFLFYLIVGILEKQGVRIDIAINILSTISFFALLIIIFKISHLLFKRRKVAYLSVILFLFNGSLSFIEFFKKNDFSSIPMSIINNLDFPSWGPYDGKVVSAFWNLNIYTNQRHLAASFLLCLLSFYLILKKIENKQAISYKFCLIVGCLSGLFYFLNQSVFIMYLVLLIGIGLFFRNHSKKLFTILFITGVIALPQYMYVNSAGIAFSPRIEVGYLIAKNFSIINFILYWVFNLGLNIFTIPFALYYSNKIQKKIFFIFFSFFLVGNLFIFSPDIAANHKFFNFFMIIGSMFSSFALYRMWSKNNFSKLIAVILFLFLTLSGIIELFPILNDKKIELKDYPSNKSINWIKNNTPPNSIFMNTNFLYDSASIAGRKIFLGWPYFPWSAGYDTDLRSKEIKAFFTLKDKTRICSYLSKNGIGYIYLTKPSEFFPFNRTYWASQFIPVFKNFDELIFSSKKICK